MVVHYSAHFLVRILLLEKRKAFSYFFIVIVFNIHIKIYYFNFQSNLYAVSLFLSLIILLIKF